jgi:peptidoglycan/LPS O-acetylase OafA/YrhL
VDPNLCIAATVLVAIAVASVIHTWVEQPAVTLLRARWRAATRAAGSWSASRGEASRDI